jgi:hypothetical protein
MYPGFTASGRFEVAIDENSAYSSDLGATGYAQLFNPTDAGAWIEFIIRNVPVGKYNILLSYHRDVNFACSNVNIYWRNNNLAFDWQSQLLLASMNMRDQKYSEYGQDRNIGQVNVTSYGDYTLRFSHIDINFGAYDIIKLIPVR